MGNSSRHRDSLDGLHHNCKQLWFLGEELPMSSLDDNAQRYLRFSEAFNNRNYDQLDQFMTVDFIDHHPGLVDVTSLAVYRKNLASIIDALEMKAIPEDVVATADKVFTRIKLTGKHVGAFLGIPPTGNSVAWYTHELWRVENGKFVERWAVDDLLSLLGQMGVPLPSWQGPE
jgi:predicted ester cyclase